MESGSKEKEKEKEKGKRRNEDKQKRKYSGIKENKNCNMGKHWIAGRRAERTGKGKCSQHLGEKCESAASQSIQAR